MNLADHQNYACGELHASEDVAQRGLSWATETAAKFPQKDAPGEEGGFYAAGYVDELLWLASLGAEEMKRDGARLRRFVELKRGGAAVHYSRSKLDELCDAGMRSRER